MNKLTNLIGTNVFDVSQSMLIGSIFSFTLNKTKTKINSLFIADEESEITYTLPTKKVFSFSSVMIIKNFTALSVVADSTPDTIMNAKVVSISGETFGNMEEIEFDNKFNITSLHTNSLSFKPSQIINYANHILIVNTTQRPYPLSYFKPSQKAIELSSETQVRALSNIPPPKEITAK